jgi:cytochrome c
LITQHIGDLKGATFAWMKTTIWGMVNAAVCLAVLLGTGLVAARALVQAAEAESAQAAGDAPKMMHESDCFSCHSVDKKVVGPAFSAVAARYSGKPDAVSKLVEKVKNGGAGNWGDIPMPPHPQFTDAQLKTIVEWVLAQNSKAAPAAAPANGAKTYNYKLPDGRTLALHFPVFSNGDHVTSSVFKGWEKFNSYCFRCHGTDAVGSEYAPDLRHSLESGMTKSQFITVMMEGVPDKGMPKWSGFFDPDDADEIYQYVKARSVGLVKPGRPSE